MKSKQGVERDRGHRQEVISGVNQAPLLALGVLLVGPEAEF